MSSSKPPREVIRERVDSLLDDLLETATSQELLFATSRLSSEITTAGFAPFFGSVQPALRNNFLLGLMRMLERVNARHDVTSIPSVLDLIAKYEGELDTFHESAVRSTLATMSNTQFDLDTPLSECFQSTYLTKLDSLSVQVDTLRMLRNKGIAHNERHAIENYDNTTWSHMIELMVFCGVMVAHISRAYLNSVLDSTGKLLHFSYAQEPAMNLSRLVSRLVESTASDDGDA